jgi:hypothetical protein
VGTPAHFADDSNRWLPPVSHNRAQHAVGSIDRLICSDSLLQRGALEELHGDERVAILIADVMNRADVRVVQAGCNSCLATESAQGLHVASHVIAQEFECDEPMEANTAKKCARFCHCILV